MSDAQTAPAQSAPAPGSSSPSAWKRNVTVFLASQALSMFGSSLVQYAIMWHITLSTKSGIAMTLSIVCGFVPSFLISPFGGVFADRYDRKRMIMLADGLVALVSAALALAYGLGGGALWLLLTAQALRSVGQALQMPAVGAILPQLVPEGELMRVNGLNQTILSAVMLVSPIASGALLSWFSISAIFLVDVATAVPAIAILAFFLKIEPRKAKEKADLAAVEKGYLHDLVLGFRYIRDHRYLAGFFRYIAVLFFLVTPAAFLTPLQATRTFGDQVWRLTAIEIAFSVGMMIGGALLASWGGFRNRVRTMLTANLLWAFCTLALGLVPWFWLYLAFMVLFGVVMPAYHAPMTTMLQERVEADFMGRVFGVQVMLQTSIMPLSMLIFGPLADAVQIEFILIGTGALMLVQAVLTYRDARLLEAGEPKETADSN